MLLVCWLLLWQSQLHVLVNALYSSGADHACAWRALQPPHVLWSDVALEAHTCQSLNEHTFIFVECTFLLIITKRVTDRSQYLLMMYKCQSICKNA